MSLGGFLFMRTEGADMKEFMLEVCERWRSEVSYDWRELRYSSIVYLARPGSHDSDGIEIVIGSEECQLSVGRHLSLDLAVRDAREATIAKSLVLSSVADGVSIWRCSRKKAFAFGISSAAEAQAVLGCREVPVREVHWESWLSPELASATWSRFSGLERTAWFRSPLWSRVSES
jgi:hypothetical protein